MKSNLIQSIKSDFARLHYRKRRRPISRGDFEAGGTLSYSADGSSACVPHARIRMSFGRDTMKQKMVAVLVVLVAHLLVFQSAQAFPDRPIKLVVPSPAGGPPDVMARLLSDKMAAHLGQPVIVENRSGAGGTIGARSVLAAEPDGYTLLMGSTSTLLIAPAIYKNAGYHAGSFAPVARVADSTEVLAVHPSVPASSVAELVAVAKSRPGALNFGSAGNRNASPYRRRAAEGARADRYEPRSLSRRRPGPDGPARRAGPGSLLHPDPNAPEYPGRPCAGIGCDQRSPQQAGAGAFRPWSRAGSISSS